MVDITFEWKNILEAEEGLPNTKIVLQLKMDPVVGENVETDVS